MDRLTHEIMTAGSPMMYERNDYPDVESCPDCSYPGKLKASHGGHDFLECKNCGKEYYAEAV